MTRRILVGLCVVAVVAGIGWSTHEAGRQKASTRAACYGVLVDVFFKATTNETPNAPTVDGPPKECQGLSQQEIADVSAQALQEGFRRGSKILDQRHPNPTTS